jgi:hypothetical protein
MLKLAQQEGQALFPINYKEQTLMEQDSLMSLEAIQT